MFLPPSSPRDQPLVQQPTWRNVLLTNALVAAIPLLLVAVSQPLAAVTALAVAGGLFVGGRRAYRLAHYFSDCQQFSFDLAGRAQITVRQLSTEEANCPGAVNASCQ